MEIAYAGLERLWLASHIFIYWARRAAAVKVDGLQLGFPKSRCEVKWFGVRGLRWDRLLPLVVDYCRQFQRPTVLLMHAGGNDLGFVPQRELVRHIKRDLGKVGRKKVNKLMGSFVRRIGDSVVHHPDLEEVGQGEFYLADGMHLNDFGLQLFLLDFKEVLCKISLHKEWERLPKWMAQTSLHGQLQKRGTEPDTGTLTAVKTETINESVSKSIPEPHTLLNMTIPICTDTKIRKKNGVIQRYKRARQTELPSGVVPGLAFSRQRLHWLLMPEGYSLHLTLEEQKRTLRLAFRLWSEVIPIYFEERSLVSHSGIEIRVGFGTGRHFGCLRVFSREGKELAHSGPHGEIHFNDDQHFTTSEQHGVSLLRVAVHEIGHVLGLPHSTQVSSVMFPLYSTEDNRLELDISDRKAVQQLYGICEGPFDAVFDWLRVEHTSYGVDVLRFNTFFFRRGWFWMYENSKNRTRHRDPQPIPHGWEGLPEAKMDAAVHVWNSSHHDTYFFSGVHFWKFDGDGGRVFSADSQRHRFPQPIERGFPGISGPIDTAYYNRTAQTVYFFTGNMVTVFDVQNKKLAHGFPKKISEVFPAVLLGDHPMGNLDAAYYSYTHQALFFFKGVYYWRVAGDLERKQDPSLPVNGLLPKKRVSEQWFDICDVAPE
ncbi:matrix metalloproteinase-21-like [Bombina bombina]|uniref:matrix metalloproteinase-21-like n=1 Tax=Bombina bombina TaxID=8345 RepID=UPI00235AF117|nr:matrix metalloproteinase-21-like [Bombina bombina]